MIARRNQVFLVNIAAREAVKQREPGAGSTEEASTAFDIGAAEMPDILGPAVIFAGDGAHRIRTQSSAS